MNLSQIYQTYDYVDDGYNNLGRWIEDAAQAAGRQPAGGSLENLIMDAKIAHLQMILGVVNRMAGNSFMVKGWSVTLVAALFALAAADTNPLSGGACLDIGNGSQPVGWRG